MRLNQSTESKPLHVIFVKLLGELFLSGFAGLITFLLCKEFGLSFNMTSVAEQAKSIPEYNKPTQELKPKTCSDV